MGSDVFISYAQGDRGIAEAACATMEAADLQCWIAPRDIPAGRDWRMSIVNAIRDARLFVLVFSARSNESDNVPREVSIALRNGKVVVPLRTEDAEPTGALQYSIGDAQWVDAVARPIDPCLRDLLFVVENQLADTNDFGGRGTSTRSDEQASGEPRPAAPLTPRPSERTARHSSPAALPSTDAGQRGTRVLPLALAGVLVVVCAVLAAVLVVGLARRGATANTTAATTPTTPISTAAPTSRPTSPTAPPTTQPPELRLAATQIGLMLVDAANGFTKLNQQILSPALSCTMSGSEAASQMNGVIGNRQDILDSVNALRYSNATAITLVGQFRHAIQLSLDSDRSYQTWAQDAGAACPSTSSPEWASASSIGTMATSAKEAFVAAFDPVAAEFQLKSDWTRDF